MKKLLLLILIFGLTSASLYFLSKQSDLETFGVNHTDAPADKTQHGSEIGAGSDDRAWKREQSTKERRVIRPQRTSNPLATDAVPAKEDLAEPANSVSIPLGADDALTVISESAEDALSLPPGSVVQTAADFAKGQMENLVVDGGLRLKPLEASGSAPDDLLWGTLQSPEFEAEKPFGRIKVMYEGSRSDDTELNLDFRVRFENGTWSEWQEASWDFAPEFQLKMPASAWQYRVTMSAPNVFDSPQVDRVIVIAQNNP